MENLIVNFISGDVKTYTNIEKTIVSDKFLIVVTKQVNENAELMITHEILRLTKIKNYTIKMVTKKYTHADE